VDILGGTLPMSLIVLNLFGFAEMHLMARWFEASSSVALWIPMKKYLASNRHIC